MKIVVDIPEDVLKRTVFYREFRDLNDYVTTIKALEQAIPLDDAKTGYWIDADGDNATCSCCNRLNHLYGEYCKHCGAKMVDSQESGDGE